MEQSYVYFMRLIAQLFEIVTLDLWANLRNFSIMTLKRDETLMCGGTENSSCPWERQGQVILSVYLTLVKHLQNVKSGDLKTNLNHNKKADLF